MNLPFRPSLPLLDNDVLRTFVAIADTGNFSTAAEAVLRTPSAVSMQIKKLEEQLRVTLFLRDARSVTLTPHGEMLLSYARRMIALSNEAVSRFLMPELSGIVRLGAADDIAERLLPSILKDFAGKFPGIMVDVTVDMSMRLRRRIDEQRLDLALINYSQRPHAAVGELVYKDKLVWAGARCGTAHLRDPLPISIWEDGCIWRQVAVAGLETMKRPYRIAYLSANTMAQRAAVVSDLAIAPFPRSYITDDMAILGVKEGLPDLMSFDVRLLSSGDLSVPAKAVAQSIREAYSEMEREAA
ncbi:DNA-binding transcriptional regulator, LysR family [Rhizobium sp. RU35A]|uniref:HTH-type transcriptional regulator TtuA n=1 Tax=Rhizobium straminoryzae TaxID=1387186 RepID=A0A549TD07_9HYPH|nr:MULTISPECIES: LysR family transcriptional regulator [Rhizobium]TRL39865.1 LysR family transcriptional regulator [Rhizobium straminoryzae]SIQ56786.1 DNA-binding transcriptional regulator, LysR family [Rhizobium sp. RU35A]